MNDRMFYGRRPFAKIWATRRFCSVPSYLRQNGVAVLHSESFIRCSGGRVNYVKRTLTSLTRRSPTRRWLMRDAPISLRSICFYRVRANGQVADRDCTVPGAWWAWA